ncbi:MAG: 50S ribosome-binding GTPase, partial [Planctomycetota bacterium]|nr:50S ribosome-binding GTPase [Planctomycetota bacterium]
MEGRELTRFNPPTATVARLTPRGRGAVATLRLLGSPTSLDAGDPSLFQAANGLRIIDQPPGRLVFGRFGTDSPEEVVVCRLNTTTLELHCHGGDAAVERIVRELGERGVVIVSPWAGEPRYVDSLEAECLVAVANALTPRMANLAHSQASGVLRRAVMAALDPLPDFVKTGERVRAIWRWREVGQHVTVPWRVAVVGRPNVGKSRLINALLGYDRSIVYDAPGTTRDVLTGETAFDGWPVQLADTAGLREAVSAIEAEGIVRARDYLATADLVLVVVDLSQPATR